MTGPELDSLEGQLKEFEDIIARARAIVDGFEATEKLLYEQMSRLVVPSVEWDLLGRLLNALNVTRTRPTDPTVACRGIRILLGEVRALSREGQ